MGNLGKRLKRELIKSPAKGALLGLVCLVALWYWAPIFGSWFGGASNAPRDIRVVKSEELDEPEAGLIVNAKDNAGEVLSTVFSWQTLAKWIDEDPRTHPAIVPEDNRDPFRRPEVSTAEDLIRQIQEDAEEESTKLAAQPETPASKEVGFSDLDLVLGGTLVGRHFRSATINGNTYWLRNEDAAENGAGQIIRIPIGAGSGADSESNGQMIELRLVDVRPDHVVLRLHGEEHRLGLQRPRLAVGNQIVRQDGVSRTRNDGSGEIESTDNLGFLRNVIQWFGDDM